MSQQIHSKQRPFCYQNFYLDKSQPLGHGSYGAVYKAKCDQLPCAAKVLHPTILDPRDPGVGKITERFDQECAFLSTIRHPHIVQYLGMTTDLESKLPVLLMELLDESLTKKLELSKQPLAYHIQVDICHDISLAVAYLHSNDIIHRDLSSNNVLIMAGRRAKVTDFGMSKLVGTAPLMTHLTMCPGTLAFMPPEAVRERPKYTKKLDCFSEGVIMIQVCTRLWPDPGPRTYNVPFPASPTGSIEMPVLETERRKKHIETINPTHPLLPIIVDCLSYKEEERPSAKEICKRLASLKEKVEYVKSLKEARDGCANTEPERREVLEREELKNQQIQQLQEQLSAKSNQITLYEQEREQQRQEMERMRQQMEQSAQQINNQQEAIEELTQQSEQLRQEIGQQRQEINQQKQEIEQKGIEIEQKNATIVSLEQQLNKTKTKLEVKVKLLKDKTDELLLKERKIREKSEEVASKEQQLQDVRWQLQEQKALAEIQKANKSPQGQRSKPHQRNRAESLPCEATDSNNKDALKWTTKEKAPFEMLRGSVATDGTTTYLMDQSGKVCSFDATTKKWSTLPDPPYQQSCLALVKGQLTTIGGKSNKSDQNEARHSSGSRIGNELLTFTRKGRGEEREWMSRYPPMPTRRYGATAITTATRGHLIVAGGATGPYQYTNTVEIMDMLNLVWSTGASLPYPYIEASAAICGDRIFMLGGEDHNCKMSRSVLTCSLSKLIQPQGAPLPQWGTISDVPNFGSTCVTLRGELMAIGGHDKKSKDVAAVYKYNPMTNLWEEFGHMTVTRSSPLTCVLSTGELMVVGGAYHCCYGELKSTDTVEIATNIS